MDHCSIDISAVSNELESIRNLPAYEGVEFPPECRRLLQSLPGNSFCVDCGNPGPDWASVTYGCLLCLHCSGRHRSYGVQTSFVRSITMDVWSHTQILSVLEGGNDQLNSFFERHQMGVGSTITTKRYLTKAGRFYRTNLSKHVEGVASSGVYKGRDASRNKKKKEDRSPPKHTRSMQPTRRPSKKSATQSQSNQQQTPCAEIQQLTIAVQ